VPLEVRRLEKGETWAVAPIDITDIARELMRLGDVIETLRGEIGTVRRLVVRLRGQRKKKAKRP
jgi:hypothetical protein